MTRFQLETWDDGRLVVNAHHAAALRSHNLTTFESLWTYAGGTVAKNLLKERTTTRIDLNDEHGRPAAYYLKRHTRAPWKEYIKPFLRLTWPVLGARPEWDAILRFHAAGIATMTPVALGESKGRSMLLTAAIEGCRKLSHLMDERPRIDAPQGLARPASLRAGASRTILSAIAASARTMHQAGLHHQDFYLTHMLVPADGEPNPLYVIDLGRVRHQPRLAQRWIIKDLAQLNYSAHSATRAERMRFLREYLGRRPNESDRAMVRTVVRKTERIARHSRKNAL